MHNKILVIPDIHGRRFWVEALNLIDMVDKVVFLGDYLDPYLHEEISFDKAVENFKDILSFKMSFPDKVVLLLGNHDMHYYDLDFMDCSRLNYSRREEMHKLYFEFREYFQLAYADGEFLFSHAGIVQPWIASYYDGNLDSFLNKSISDVPRKSLEVISYIRGGWDLYGSCIWSDLREFSNGTEYYQIFGHTQMESKPYIADKFACLDVRECFILDTLTKEIKSTSNI